MSAVLSQDGVVEGQVELVDQLLTVGGERLTIEKLRDWNKSGTYPASPVDIFITERGDLASNAEALSLCVADVEDRLTESLLDCNLDKAENIADELSQVQKWMIETRKPKTANFDTMKKEFTALEKRLLVCVSKAKDRADELKEESYQATEKVFSDALGKALDESGFAESVSMKLFDGFLQKKRKLKNVLKTTGGLTAAHQRAVDEQVELVVKPLRDAKELAERKDQQHALFSELVAAKDTMEELGLLKAQAEDMFPDICGHVVRDIDGRIRKLALAKKMAEEAEAARLAEEKRLAEEAEAARIAEEKRLAEEAEAVHITDNASTDLNHGQYLPWQVNITDTTPTPAPEPTPETVEPVTHEEAVKSYIAGILHFAAENRPQGIDSETNDGKALAYVERNLIKIKDAIDQAYGA